ncbi:MAG: TRAP transporter permease, partial [Synergistaceae bacterium]|nr:TRAP transporter permease [Synergistaceae bacterium]
MRKLSGTTKTLIYLYVLAMGVFHLYTASAGNYEAYLQRSIHLAFVLPLAFVLFPMTKGAPKDRVPVYDWILAVLAAAPGVYSMVNYTAI